MGQKILNALIFDINFFTAHFKRHETKKFRSTYLIPPPTSIWGIIGAMVGLPRDKVHDFIKKKNLMVGGMLQEMDTIFMENVTLHQIKGRTRERTVEQMLFVYNPTYRIALATEDREFLSKIQERITQYNFEYTIFGGITDCLMKNITLVRKVGETHPVYEKNNVRGMVPAKLLEHFIPLENDASIIIKEEDMEVKNVNNPKTNKFSTFPHKSFLTKVLYLNEFCYQEYKCQLILKEERLTVDHIALWSFDDVEHFKYGKNS